jgi:clan AA aspartic protease (TIGR02281 family)
MRLYVLPNRLQHCHRLLFQLVLCCALFVLAGPAKAQSICIKLQGTTFATDVIVNGTVTIAGVIDSGASDPVLICDAVVDALKLRADTPLELQTSSATATAYEVVLDSVRIGPIQIRRVSALMISQTGPCRLLLGLSLLRRLESVTFMRDKFILLGPKGARKAKCK